jgi:phosphatidylethanolamine/phosphatidyl-N-methylethanolamine N-methyltransferase
VVAEGLTFRHRSTTKRRASRPLRTQRNHAPRLNLRAASRAELELELLPADLRVTGIDISAAMLDVARERVARKGLRQVKGLHVMDAGAMDFADGQFDAAMAPYVMSVVPNPARVLSETWRVIRPGGRMVVMNHFAAAGGPRAAIEAAMEKVAWWLGWHPKFPYSTVGDWIAAQPDAELVERRELSPLSLFTLLVIGKRVAAL